MNSRSTCVFSIALGILALNAGCGPAVRRDLSNIPQRQITYDDMCHLQDYFDQRNASGAPGSYRAENEQSTETAETEPDENGRMRRAVLGEGTYVISDRPARRELRRLLEAEYQRLPEMHFTAPEDEVRVHVGWWASGQMRRLRPDRGIEITASTQTVVLPFDPCLGEFLFGAPIYAMRRSVLDADRARARGEIPALPSAAPESAAPSGEPSGGSASVVPPSSAGPGSTAPASTAP